MGMFRQSRIEDPPKNTADIPTTVRADQPGAHGDAMKRGSDSIWGAVAFMAMAVALAYLAPDAHHETDNANQRSEETVAPAKAVASEGHGRHATAPTHIPFSGWKDILWRTYEQIGDDRLLAVAAGVVFYGLLALFPAITALVSSYALFVDPKSINDHLSFLATFLPEGTFSIVQDQINRVLSKGDMKLRGAFVFSLLLALWSANGGMKAIIDALNVVYDEKEKRGLIKLNLVSLSFTIGGVLAILTGGALVILVPVALQTIGMKTQTELLVRFGRWPALAILLLLALAVLYRYGPSRRSPKWRWISVGSATATVTWIAGSALLSYYLSNFGHYDATYGSLGAAIALMMWMWMTTSVILFGAELNSEIEHQILTDSTTGAPKPLGDRGARMADTVGAIPRRPWQ
jgi:membrane protein